MSTLIEICEETRVIKSEEIPKSYLVDLVTGQEGSAHALVFPTSTQEVKELMVYAKNHDLSVIARGAGTGLTGATLPVRQELLIDFSKMNRILNFDSETLTLTVEPGVTLEEIQSYVESQGYFYPPDPGSKAATIGGTIATNAGGMRAVKYGVTRDYVRQLEIVLLSGEVLTVGGLTEKNSSGYDLKDLFIGSEGTLGITTKIDLRVVVPPKVSQSFVIAFDNLESISKTILGILSSGVAPTALEFFEKEAMGFSELVVDATFPFNVGSSYLLLTVDGNDILDIEKRGAEAIALGKENGALQEFILDEATGKAVWQLRGSITSGIETVSQLEPIDVAVPINKITESIQYMKALGLKYELRTIAFGHGGDGNIHACILREGWSEEAWERRLHALLSEFYAHIAEQEGVPSAEHGIGLLKKEFFLRDSDPTYVKYLSEIKKVFDPENRLNPTKIF